jgi:hypothetical protein
MAAAGGVERYHPFTYVELMIGSRQLGNNKLSLSKRGDKMIVDMGRVAQ